MDSASHPELAQQGSWSRSASTIYSAADLAAVVKRATDRFVHVRGPSCSPRLRDPRDSCAFIFLAMPFWREGPC